MKQIPREFAEAFLNSPHKVLGKTLQPYCLFHVLALQVIDSPAVIGGRLTLEELEKAVLICSIPLPRNQREAAKYSEKVTTVFAPKSRLKKWRLYFWHKRNEKRFNAEVKKFQEYIKDFATFPRVSNETKGQGSGANHILARAGFYIHETGSPVEYVFSLPLGQLNHLGIYFSAMNSGKISFLEEIDTKIGLYKKLLEEINKQAVDK